MDLLWDIESILRAPRGIRQNIPEKARGILSISLTKGRELDFWREYCQYCRGFEVILPLPREGRDIGIIFLNFLTYATILPLICLTFICFLEKSPEDGLIEEFELAFAASSNQDFNPFGSLFSLRRFTRMLLFSVSILLRRSGAKKEVWGRGEGGSTDHQDCRNFSNGNWRLSRGDRSKYTMR